MNVPPLPHLKSITVEYVELQVPLIEGYETVVLIAFMPHLAHKIEVIKILGDDLPKCWEHAINQLRVCDMAHTERIARTRPSSGSQDLDVDVDGTPIQVLGDDFIPF